MESPYQSCRYEEKSPCIGTASLSDGHQMYCILHFRGDKSEESFRSAVQEKLNANDYDFTNVWFPTEVDLSGLTWSEYTSFLNTHFERDVNFSKSIFEARVSFYYTTFNGRANFEGVIFAGETDFTDSKFRGIATLSQCEFRDETSFSTTQFDEDVSFRQSTFRKSVLFQGTRFRRNTNFEKSIFSSFVEFDSIILQREANFIETVFEDGLSFIGNRFSTAASMNFSGSVFREPSNAVFGDVTLAVHWFVGIDVRACKFVNVRWRPIKIDKAIIRLSVLDSLANRRKLRRFSGGPVLYPTRRFRLFRVLIAIATKQVPIRQLSDITPLNHLERFLINIPVIVWASWNGRSVKDVGIRTLLNTNPLPPVHDRFSITLRQLAVNAEEHHRYEEASRFRYASMDTLRRTHFFGLVPWRLTWWYWLGSGYGERPARAFIVLLLICLTAAWIYTKVGFARWEPKATNGIEANELIKTERDEIGAPLSTRQSLTYSVGVLMFQKPEPRPVTAVAQAVVTAESVFGPLQIALLGLSVRRKFIR
jgi:uncharacterized protein YjbI with pentapeptide repeats